MARPNRLFHVTWGSVAVPAAHRTPVQPRSGIPSAPIGTTPSRVRPTRPGLPTITTTPAVTSPDWPWLNCVPRCAVSSSANRPSEETLTPRTSTRPLHHDTGNSRSFHWATGVDAAGDRTQPLHGRV